MSCLSCWVHRVYVFVSEVVEVLIILVISFLCYKDLIESLDIEGIPDRERSGAPGFWEGFILGRIR